MNHDDFSRYARFPTAESLRLDEVVVRAGNDTFHMNGSLRIAEQTFVLDLVLRERLSLERQGIGEWLRRLWRRSFGTPRSETRDLPRIGGFVGASQFWNVSGIIENSLRFHCRTVPSSHGLSLGEISSRGARFEVSRLSLAHDPMTHEQTSQLISRLNNPKGNVRERILDSSFFDDNPLGDVAFEFRSVIPRVKPLWKTSFTETVETNEYLGSSTVTRRDTLTGHASDYEFALIEGGEDMELHMRYRSGQDGSEEAARARFSALAQAVAFTHGCEPWFQRFEVHRGVQRIEDIVTARQFVPKTILQSFVGKGV
jgi:hypothetical protein